MKLLDESIDFNNVRSKIQYFQGKAKKYMLADNLDLEEAAYKVYLQFLAKKKKKKNAKEAKERDAQVPIMHWNKGDLGVH